MSTIQLDGPPGCPFHQHGRPLEKDSPWAMQNVLTFDGGGVRGYYSLLHLEYLMKIIKKTEEAVSKEMNTASNISSSHDNLSSFSPCTEPKDFSFSKSAESHFLPCHYFDYISGTSTGALITIMLTTLRMSVDDCLAEYETLAEKVFGHARLIHHVGKLGILVTKNKYATTNLENAIKDVIRRRGEVSHDHDDAMQFRTPKGLCRAIVFANRSIKAGLYDQLWVFRSYDNFPPSRDQKSTERALNAGRGTNFAAWKVARAATAAYLYFKPLEIALDDGEVIRRPTIQLTRRLSEKLSRQGTDKAASRTRNTILLSDAGFSRVNNPSTKVLQEVRSMLGDGPKKVANWVSIGTARRTSPHGTSNLQSVLKKAAFEIGDPEIEHEQMEQLQPREFEYYRLNEPNGLPNVEMDDWKSKRSQKPGAETIDVMKAAFHSWVANPVNQDIVQKAATNLVGIRRARTTNKSMWERFALGRLFICPAKDCYLDPDETWHYQDSFIQHLVFVHKYNEAQVEKAVRDSSRDWEYKPQNMYS